MLNKDIQDWNRIASSYVQLCGGPKGFNREFTSVLWESLGDVNGLQVLDLGCGAGWLSQLLSKAGGEVLGIDGSVELVKEARAAFPAIEFMEHDLSQGIPLLNRTFDRIIANMVLMDISDITMLIQSVQETLAPSGKFIFTIHHPCFFNADSCHDERGQFFKRLTRYLQPEVRRIEYFGGHNHYHRSLTFYFDHLRQNRMAVTRLYEPRHISHKEKQEDGQEFVENIPNFIFIEAMTI